MFCHNCGQSDQSPETYCRKCGTFLPDLDKLAKKPVAPEEHIKANSFLSLMTAVVSLTLAISLNVVILGREGTHWLIYIVMGFLFAITAWQVQTYIRMRMLKKQFEKLKPVRGNTGVDSLEGINSEGDERLLNEADFADVIPASVTERTTKDLTGRKRSSA